MIASLVKQCCEDEAHYGEVSGQILIYVKANASNKEAPKPIVDTVKQLIKDRKADSPQKVLALKLLHQCLMEGGGTEEIAQYMEKKIMSRLSTLARYKKDSNDLERGSHLFGNKGYHPKASADFLKLLLLYLQLWAARFPLYPSGTPQAGKPTEMAKIYQQLVRERVHFPSEEAVLSSLGCDYNDQSSSQYNPTSTAHQSLNQSAYISQSTGGPLSSRSNLTSHHPQDLNMSAMTELQRPPQQQTRSQPLSREEQLQMANQIKADYKKLNEYHETAKLASEVLESSGKHSHEDPELYMEFHSQLSEGKSFSEKFLKTIMETSFAIKDRETKIEKILGIISLIDQCLAKLLTIKPQANTRHSSKEETKDSSQQSSNNSTMKQHQQPINEVKGILKKQPFITVNPQSIPQQTQKHQLQTNIPQAPNPGGFDFPSFDKNAFKTNFSVSNASFNDFEGQHQKPPQSVQVLKQTDQFMDFAQENLGNARQDPAPFDFGFNQAQSVNFDWGFPSEGKSNPLSQSEKKSSGVKSDKFDTSPDIPSAVNASAVFQRTHQQSLQQPPLKLAAAIRGFHDIDPLRLPQHFTQRSEMDTPLNFSKSPLTQQPQLIRVTNHSNPLSDADDDHISSSDDGNRSELPSVAMQESRQILNQSMRSKQSRFRGEDEPPIIIKKATLTVRSSMPVLNSSQLYTQTDRINPSDRLSFVQVNPANQENRPSAKREFEKFDFSEVQNSERSLSRGRQDSARLKLEELTRQNQDLLRDTGDLRDQVSKARALAGKHEQQCKKLEQLLDQMQQDVRRLKRVELLYDDEQHQRIEVEQRRLRELEEMEQRYEGQRQQEADRTRGQMEEVFRVMEERSSELEEMREAERRASQRVEEVLKEVRAKEEEIVQVNNEWAARMKTLTDDHEQFRYSQDMQRLQWNQTMHDAVEAKAQEKDLEIDLLKRRIQDLEAAQQQKPLMIKTSQIKLSNLNSSQVKQKESSGAIAPSQISPRQIAFPEPIIESEELKEGATQEVVEFVAHSEDLEFGSGQVPTPSLSLFPSVIKPNEQTYDFFEVPHSKQHQPDAHLNHQQSKIEIFDDSSSSDDDEEEEVKQFRPYSDGSYLGSPINNEVAPEDAIAQPEDPKQVLQLSGKKNPPVDPFDFSAVFQDIVEPAKPQASNGFDFSFPEEPQITSEQIKQPDPFNFSLQANKVPEHEIQFPQRENPISVLANHASIEVVYPSHSSQNQLDADSETESEDFSKKHESHHILYEEGQIEVREEDLPEDIEEAKPLSQEVQENPYDTDAKKGLRDDGRFNVGELLAGIVGTDTSQAQVVGQEEFVEEELKEIQEEQPALIQIQTTNLLQSRQFSPPRSQSPIQLVRAPLLPQPSLVQRIQPDSPFQQKLPPFQHPLTPLAKPEVSPQSPLDRSQFSTNNTASQAQQQMAALQQLSPQMQMQMMLLSWFRKAQQSNKAVIYEDPNVQLGLVGDFQLNGIVRMRLFFGNKLSQVAPQGLTFKPLIPPQGYKVMQSRENIDALIQGQQEPVDINIQVDSYLISPLAYNLQYNQGSVSIPLRLPLTSLRLCQAPAHLDEAPVFRETWNACLQEVKQLFNIDFGICRSLSQLKETLKLGRNALTFTDGVEPQKNVVCGATQFGYTQVLGLVKITVTVDGNACEIVSRSNEPQSDMLSERTFARVLVGNILELIALPAPLQKRQQ